MAEIDNSLRRLGTDYVDPDQIHRWDYETPCGPGTRRRRGARRTSSGAGLDRDEDVEIADRTLQVAERLGRPPAQVAMAWLFAKPGDHRADRRRDQEQHRADAVAAVDVDLSGEDIAALEEPYRPHPIVGHA